MAVFGTNAEPTLTPPGSPERIAVLAARAAANQPLHVAGDLTLDGLTDDASPLAPLFAVLRNGARVRVGDADRRHAAGAVSEAAAGFGRRLRTERRRKGLSQVGLAAKVGLSRKAIQNLEAGRSLPRLDTAAALGAALAVSVTILLADVTPTTR